MQSTNVSIPHRYSTNLRRLRRAQVRNKSFNPSQVFYKLELLAEDLQATLGFQSLIGILQTFQKFSIFFQKILFQSLIGILQTIQFTSYIPIYQNVSIPHRYSTNIEMFMQVSMVLQSFNPSQVFYKRYTSSVCYFLNSLFQSLIGILQTQFNIYALAFLYLFQSLIGILQTC